MTFGVRSSKVKAEPWFSAPKRDGGKLIVLKRVEAPRRPVFEFLRAEKLNDFSMLCERWRGLALVSRLHPAGRFALPDR
jgi:hypothetical protein